MGFFFAFVGISFLIYVAKFFLHFMETIVTFVVTFLYIIL